MYSVSIYVIGLYVTCLASTAFGTICENCPTRGGIIYPPMKFAFREGFKFNLLIQFKNIPPQVTAILIVCAQQVNIDGPLSNQIYEWHRNQGDDFRLCGILAVDALAVGIELYSSKGLCAEKLVAHGREAGTLLFGKTDTSFESRHLCLRYPDSTCAVEMDLSQDCVESQTDENKSSNQTSVIQKTNISETERNTTSTTKPTISDTPVATQNVSNNSSTQITPNDRDSIWLAWDTFWRIAATFNETLSSSDVPQNLRNTPNAIQNVSVTSNLTDNKTNDSEIKTYAIAIPSALAVVALILFAIIMIKKRCCVKRSPNTLEVQTNKVTGPFYVNLLFRRECDKEIELMDQHIYEKIDPQ